MSPTKTSNTSAPSLSAIQFCARRDNMASSISSIKPIPLFIIKFILLSFIFTFSSSNSSFCVFYILQWLANQQFSKCFLRLFMVKSCHGLQKRDSPFNESWFPLMHSGIQGVHDHLLKEGKGEEAEKPQIKWGEGPETCIEHKEALHQFKLEHNKISYSKFSLEEGDSVDEDFEAEVFEKIVEARWNLKTTSIDDEKVNDVLKRVIGIWIELGGKRAKQELRQLGLDSHQANKFFKELKKMETTMADDIMKQKKEEKEAKKKETRKEEETKKEEEARQETTEGNETSDE